MNLIALLTVAVIVALILWRGRRRRGPSTATRPRDAAASAMRRFERQRQSGRHPAETLDDPRLAAAGMMAAIARMEGELTRRHVDALRVECRAAFRVPQTEADDIAAYGRWLAEQFDAPDEALERLSRALRALAPAEAHRDMIRMLERVAAAETAGVSPRQRQAIDGVRGALGVA